MRTPVRRRLAAIVLVTSVLVACAGVSTRVDGTLVTVVNTGDPDNVAVVVEPDEGDQVGSTDVEVVFDLEDLRCIEGREATLDDLRPGIDVRARRSDSSEIETSDPPIVRGADVAIRCDD